MSEWVNILCRALRETDIKQINGNLVRYDYEGNVEGKCALGIISCDIGLTLERGKDEPSYESIMGVAGVPDEFNKNETNLPTIWRIGLEKNIELTMRDDYNQHLWANIFTLNDAGLSFKEIADWIETTFEDVE